MQRALSAKACSYPVAISLLAGAFAFGIPSAPARADTSAAFGPNSDLATTNTVPDLAIGDINGDGDRDLVTINGNVTSISVLLGDGDGGFGAPTDYATSNQPATVALADLNADGRMDVVATTSGARVAVWLGQSNGGLGPINEITAGSSNDALAVGDIDGDGFLDIVIGAKYFDFSDPSTHKVTALLGDGDGDFGPPTAFVKAHETKDLALSDLNNDGFLDVVTADSDPSVSVMLGDGQGQFASATQTPTSPVSNPSAVALGDLGRDGTPDVVVGTADDSNPLGILIGNGDGTFAPTVGVTAGDRPESVALGDVNGDGKLDVVAGDNNGSSADVLLGTGDGTFGTPAGFATSQTPMSTALADINNDGKLDIATGDRSLSVASTLLNTATYTPKNTVSPNTGASGGRQSVTINGTNFTGATRVKFGSAKATSVKVVSDTKITAVTPPNSPGSTAVSVVGPQVSVTSTDAYSYDQVTQTINKSTIPKKLKKRGKTVVNKSNATTNQGQPLRATVTSRSRSLTNRGDIWCLKKKKGPSRKLSVVLSGQCKLTVSVTYTAKGTSKYAPFTYTKKYKTKRVR